MEVNGVKKFHRAFSGSNFLSIHSPTFQLVLRFYTHGTSPEALELWDYSTLLFGFWNTCQVSQSVCYRFWSVVQPGLAKCCSLCCSLFLFLWWDHVFLWASHTSSLPPDSSLASSLHTIWAWSNTHVDKRENGDSLRKVSNWGPNLELCEGGMKVIQNSLCCVGWLLCGVDCHTQCMISFPGSRVKR